MSAGYRPYAPRTTSWHGVREIAGTRLRVHGVSLGAPLADLAAFEPGIALLADALPRPDPAHGRPGVGFLVLHAGRGSDYAVLGWWDRENELPVRVAVRDHGDGTAWRPATVHESFCVWDLELVAAERDAYVATVLAGAALDEGVARYLAHAAPGAR